MKEGVVEGGGGVGQREGSGAALVGAAGVAAQKASAAGADGQAGPGPMAVCQLPEEMELGESPAADLHPASATNGNGLHFSGEGEERGSEADAEAGAPCGQGGEVEEAAEPPAPQVDPPGGVSPSTLSEGSPPRADPDGGPAPMETAAFHEARSPAPSLASIEVQSGEHGWALWDHRQYCLQGTWGPGAGGPQEDQQTTSETDCTELLTEMLHEFLESFFLKYGSFIPLSETDVLEHLKKKTNMDLNKRKLDIPGEIRRFKAGLASAPVAGFMVTYNKHTLSLEDLGTMEEQNWLNDQVINMYGELIMEATQRRVHFFNSFFHKQLVAKGYEGVKRWTKKVDLFSKCLLLVPIHLEIHWSLITVNTATKTIGYYDSQGVVFKHTIDNIMKYLQSEAEEKQQTNYQKGWKMLIIRGIPQQKNDSDCGVFVLEYCRRLSMKEPLLFSQDDMPRIRKRIYKELCDCRLSD